MPILRGRSTGPLRGIPGKPQKPRASGARRRDGRCYGLHSASFFFRSEKALVDRGGDRWHWRSSISGPASSGQTEQHIHYTHVPPPPPLSLLRISHRKKKRREKSRARRTEIQVGAKRRPQSLRPQENPPARSRAKQLGLRKGSGMESTYATEESKSKDSSANASSSPTGSSVTSVDVPTPLGTKEVPDNNDHEEPTGHEEKSAQAAIENSDPHIISADLTEHHVGSNGPSDTGPGIPSYSGPTEAFANSTNDKEHHPSSADTIEVNHMPANVSNGAGTMVTDGMRSKEDQIYYQSDIAIKPKRTEDSETRPESPYRGLIDTTAPFESVREAVTKFGGIVDWKAHKAQMIERRKLIQLELEKVQAEIPHCKEELEAAEMAKSQVVGELEYTKRLIEELKHNLEKAQTEEAQAKQDSELAQLRAQEIEHGIADEASSIARTQMEVAKERHEKAVAELKSINEELRSVCKQYATLINERDTAIKRAEEVISAGKEIEKRVEELTLELIAYKGSLELAHAAHHEAEERRIGAALAKEQDCVAWEKELHQAQEELQQLDSKLLSKNDMKLNIDANLRKLLSLNSELAAYMENKLTEEVEGVSKEHESEDAKQTSTSIKETLASKQKKLQEVKRNIERAKTEANLLRFASTKLRSELENEKASFVTLQQREAMASIAVSSLEAELNRTKQEIESVRSKEADAQEKMVELPKILQQATEEAEEAKVAAHPAQEELRKAKEELEETKGAATTAEIRLCAVVKEIEACEASERLALAAVQALQQSEEARDVKDSPRRVTLPLSEYYELSKKAHEAEELANERVAEALAQVVSAKESQSRSLERLNETSEEMDEKKEALEIALERAERANEGKLAAEQELRKWRADHEQRRKAHEAVKRAVNPLNGPSRIFVEQKGPFHDEQEFKLRMPGSSYESLVPNRKLQGKKSLFPLMGSVLSRKTRAQT
ncbi:protein WEAK CHLOROPLAST MOVEMENT UNDER BLUE LIGHT 1-like [Phragmites australis]|uniref:protein WEAK CHLOROPLAST MOVEMENT UNDER BLUE LIGHT 1-like n=1 Tax=Phragmites australis TaxID=29695 RepID=UPI002D76B8D1|nr:protein WEAK CHLOROPLAST MOVEMENT UNDER BLUE LIGHT 1-like [Phragmites australis]